MTRPNDDMAHLKRDIMEALKRSDGKWMATQERPTKKWNAALQRLMKNRKLFKKDRRKSA